MSDAFASGTQSGSRDEISPDREKDGQKPNLEIRSLTGIRGIAALAVVIYHACLGAAHGTPVGFRGALAVDLFFALSGFVLTMVYLRGPAIRWRHFFSARLARIYPLYIATSLLSGIFLLYRIYTYHEQFGDAFSLVNIVREATLSTALPVFGGGTIWNDPSWSISVECWIYLLIFPLLALAQRTIPPVVSAFIVGILVIGLSAYMTEFTDSHAFTRGWSAAARAAVGFSAGWAAFRLVNEQKVSLPSWATDFIFFSVIFCIAISGLSTQSDAWFITPVFPVLLIGLCGMCGIAHIITSYRPVHYLGIISYSLYLNRSLALWIVGWVLSRFDLGYSKIAVVISTLCIAVPLSALTHKYIEMPARRWLLTRLDPTLLITKGVPIIRVKTAGGAA